MATSGSSGVDPRWTALASLLRAGPRSAKELVEALAISQPTLSRTIQSHPDGLTSFRILGLRTPQYALLRTPHPTLRPRQTVYRILSNGAIEPFADIEFLAGGGTLERTTRETVRYDGLPPYMVFSSPTGFLGRQVARNAAAALHLPESLQDWSDDHRIAYLFSRGVNLSGNLIYGEASLQREMDFRNAPSVSSAEKRQHYVAMATELRDATYGSSAGGEQPKFLSLVEDSGHVIVKFAKAGSRMASLLPLEHAALRTLEHIGVPAAKTQVFSAGDHVFLEVQRFDRLGRHGRVGMLSCGAIDDEYFGSRDTWSEFAARCEKAGYLTRDEAHHLNVLAAFSELIGNTDRHFENISMLLAENGDFAGLAPAYDILPMRYASIGGGVDPALHPITPRVGAIGAKPAVWQRAAQAAHLFWQSVQQDAVGFPVSAEFRELAHRNLAAVQTFVAPLLP